MAPIRKLVDKQTTVDSTALVRLTHLKARDDYITLASQSGIGMMPKWILELADNVSVSVRQTLAKNPAIANCPDAIVKLAADRNDHVAGALASNPAIAACPDAVNALAQHRHILVRWMLARNPALHNVPDAAKRLSEDKEQTVAASAKVTISSPTKATKPLSNAWTVYKLAGGGTTLS